MQWLVCRSKKYIWLPIRPCPSYCCIHHDLSDVVILNKRTVLFIPVSTCTHTDDLVEFSPIPKGIVSRVYQNKTTTVLYIFLKCILRFFRPRSCFPPKI